MIIHRLTNDADNSNFEMMKINMDQSDFNSHEVMANLTAVIHHMEENKINTTYSKVDIEFFSFTE